MTDLFVIVEGRTPKQLQCASQARLSRLDLAEIVPHCLRTSSSKIPCMLPESSQSDNYCDDAKSNRERGYPFIMSQPLSHHFPPRPARMHEACGAGAFGFAAALAGALGGNVMWIVERWHNEQLNPSGLADFADPSRVLTATTKDQAETLAIAEETLRSGAVCLAVAELTAPLSLTAARRLQLAAEAGRTTGLCLIPEGMGSNAAETRWRCAPIFDPSDSTRAQWEIIKNKSGTVGSWDVRWDKSARRVHVVPPVGKRPGSAGAPD